MDIKSVASAIAVLAFLVAGLFGIMTQTGWQSDDARQTQSPTVDQGGEAAKIAVVELSPKRYNTTTDRIAIAVTVRLRGYEEIAYRDPQLCLYDRDGQLLNSTSLPPISTRDSQDGSWHRNEMFRPETRPWYIIVDQPRLRNDSRFVLERRVWLPDQQGYWPYRKGLNEIQDNFQFPRSSTVGKCG
jgi:hypothetical protein